MNKKVTLKLHTGKEVDEALRWVHDLLDWCQIPNFLIGETMRQVVAQENLKVEKIEIGVRANTITQDTSKLLKTFVPSVVIDKVIKLEHQGVPIEIKTIKRKYEFLKNPDFVYYNYDEYKIPNPWTKYWRARFIVQ